jgi:DNA modification methylase
MGSGTTAVAALECNRKYIGFEIIQEYVEFANDRIQKLGIKDSDGLW